MKTEDIRPVISEAMLSEQQTHRLKNRLNALKNGLHPLLGLDQDKANETLMEFVLQYAKHVPEFIHIMEEGAENSELKLFISPFVSAAKQFFLDPPQIAKNHHGLDGLMIKSYLAHRLFEEVNDIFWSKAGYPLIPFDTNQANVIVHSIIGEPFANELDQTIEVFVGQLVTDIHNFDSKSIEHYLQGNARKWKDGCSQWPCLAGQLGIDLKLKQFYLHAV